VRAFVTSAGHKILIDEDQKLIHLEHANGGQGRHRRERHHAGIGLRQGGAVAKRVVSVNERRAQV